MSPCRCTWSVTQPVSTVVPARRSICIPSNRNANGSPSSPRTTSRYLLPRARSLSIQAHAGTQAGDLSSPTGRFPLGEHASQGLIPASPLPRGNKRKDGTEQDLDDLHRGAAAPMLSGAGSPDCIAHGEHDDQRDAPPDQEGGRVDVCPGRGEQQDEHG